MPIVTINANDPNAAEPSDGGQFTLNRTGTVANALTVYYSIGGSASNGTDYSSLSGNISFAAGSSSAIINVSTIDDSIIESQETVILTIANNSDYTVGSANSATVTITDNDIEYLIHADSLTSNLEYYKGWSLTTASGYKLIFQTDGNLVNYNPSGSPLWATGTYTDAEKLVFQLDGNLVLYNTSGKAIWATNTDGYRGEIFAFQNDGNLVIYDDNYHPLFARTPGVFNAASLWQNPTNLSSPPALMATLTELQKLINGQYNGVSLEADGAYLYECVDLVKWVTNTKNVTTSYWKRGENVIQNGNVAKGAAIAIFDSSGNYNHRHTVIFESYVRDSNGSIIGFNAWHQNWDKKRYVQQAKVYTYGNSSYNADADEYYVIKPL